jgi:hypothetical protein
MKIFAKFVSASVFLVALLSAAPAWAQTANSALVLGIVTDPAGAVVPDGAVNLTNTATNETKTATTNSAGQYVFPNVAPGAYTLKIIKSGFATTTFSNIRLDVSKSYTYDAKLEVSSGKEIVEVTAGAVAELQTTDAVMGNVVSGTMLMRLPTLGRDASELLTLQPGSTPYDSSQVGFGNNGGTIAGARSDQNSIVMDGIDVTDNVISGGATEKPIIPIGVGSVDEFRAEITNENVTFLRSSGGQIAIVSKSGGNTYHGSVYWLHQNSALNANSWDNNRNKIKKPPTHDNRGGLWVGGPIRKDRTFFFANYEIRRFPQSLQDTRIMPSDLLRQGTLQFADCSSGQFDAKGNCTGAGTLRSYDLASSTNCGADANGQPLNLACDPRNLGISPTIKTLWGMMPQGTDTNIGDGHNTLGDHLNLAAPLKTDFISFRLDHKFTDKLHSLDGTCTRGTSSQTTFKWTCAARVPSLPATPTFEEMASTADWIGKYAPISRTVFVPAGSAPARTSPSSSPAYRPPSSRFPERLQPMVRSPWLPVSQRPVSLTPSSTSTPSVLVTRRSTTAASSTTT